MFSYKKLFIKLIEEDIKRNDLIKELHISNATFSKMSKGENISLDVVEKLCEYFHCDISDIMEYVPKSKDDQE